MRLNGTGPDMEMNFSNAPGQWKCTGSGGETRFEVDPNFMLRKIFINHHIIFDASYSVLNKILSK